MTALFFKPSPTGTLYRKSIPHGKLSIRSLDLSTDLDTLYEWVNQEYARAFWQMQGSKNALKATYEAVLENPAAHSFMVLLDNSQVGQVDLYQVLADELSEHIEPALENDCGLHILMLPPRQSKKFLAEEVLRAFTEFYFSHSSAGHLYAEPDILNATANNLALKAGFKFIKKIQLSSKSANLYCISTHNP
jgi:acetyl CoA:N6-hydroxylysine acetyl transferase